MSEIRDPNDQSYQKSNVFNKKFVEYLKYSGWSDKEVRNEFVSYVNSIILSTKSNSTLQRRMLSFLETALKTLNIEIKKIAMNSNDNIVQINPDELNESISTSTDKTESKCQNQYSSDKNENCGCGCGDSIETGGEYSPKGFSVDIKTLMTDFKKELDNIGLEKNKQDKIIKYTFDISGEDKSSKKLLLGRLKTKCESAIAHIKSSQKHPIIENKDEKEDSQKNEKNVELDDNSNTNKNVEPNDSEEKETTKTKKSNNTDDKGGIDNKEKDENNNTDERNVKFNNYEVFFKNYLIDDLGYSLKTTEVLRTFVSSIVEKGKDKNDFQVKINKKLTEIKSKISSSYSSVETEEISTKNSEVSFDNLSKYGILFNGWATGEMKKYIDNLKSLFSMGKKVEIQKIIFKELKNIIKGK